MCNTELLLCSSASASQFRSYFTRPSLPSPTVAQGTSITTTAEVTSHADTHTGSHAHIDDSSNSENENLDFSDIWGGYLSDLSEMDGYEMDEEEFAGGDDEVEHCVPRVIILETIQSPPYSKWRKLAVPAREARRIARYDCLKAVKMALNDIEKLVTSKRTKFEAGHNSLQAYRARAIQSCLHMVVNNNWRLIDASERAAEGQGFAGKWGGRLVQIWVSRWRKLRELPESEKGRHGKIYSLLDDPEVCHELRAYLWSNKWSMNLKKLSDFTKNKLIPNEQKKYLIDIVDQQMPRGLKQYMETELLPHIQMKVSKGISLRTACRWLHKEGFRYTSHKKALYYDGHEREDVVSYRQNDFLPKMKEYKSRLVRYVVGDCEKEIGLNLAPGVRPLVLVAHDEMTAQCNDDEKMSWIWKGEQPLKKKGVGRGVHQSEVICSTVGHLSIINITCLTLYSFLKRSFPLLKRHTLLDIKH